MLRNTVLLALAGAASATTFNGTGQLRALASSVSGNGTSIGCITDTGAWTMDEDLCGTFTATRGSTSAIYVTLSTLNGPCTLDKSNFTCSADATALQFWVSPPYGRCFLPSRLLTN